MVTSAPGDYWKADGQVTEVTSGSATVTVDMTPTAQAQTWEGFGGSFNLSVLSQSDRDAAIRLLYGADGARFVFGRIPIGASVWIVSQIAPPLATSQLWQLLLDPHTFAP